MRVVELLRFVVLALSLTFGFGTLAPTANAQWCPDQCVCKADVDTYLNYHDCVSGAWWVVHQVYDGCCELEDSVVCDIPEPCYFFIGLHVIGHDGEDCALEAWIDGVVVYSDPHSISGNMSFLVDCGKFRWAAITSHGAVVVGVVMHCYDCKGG
jgi:hypothetical protein